MRLLHSIVALALPTCIVSAPTLPPHVCLAERDWAEHRLVTAIARLEGWGVAGSLTHRLHNPGAIRRHGAYARFATDAEGWAALKRRIEQHDNWPLWVALESFSETPGYVDKLEGMSGVSMNTVLERMEVCR